MRKNFLITLAIIAVLGLGGCRNNNASDVQDEATTSGEESYTAPTNTPTPTATNADAFKYKIVDNTIVITGLKEEQEHIVIPHEIDGIAVTCIGKEAFKGKDFISVEIPDSVTRIEEGAFRACENLVSIEIPDSVTYIGKTAFGWCHSLESVKIPKSVKEMGHSAFFGDNLKVITVEDNSVAKKWAIDNKYKVNYYSYSKESGSNSGQETSDSTTKTLSERVGGKLYVGDEFTLGTYEQDNYIDNGKEPIEWIVYSKYDNSYLCISKYVLDWQPFSSREKEVPNSWEESYMREWLNGSFYNEAFSDLDKTCLVSMDTRYPGWKDKSDNKLDRLTSYGDNVRLIGWGEFDEHPGCVKVTEFAKMQLSYTGSYMIDDGTREHENCCDNWGMMTVHKGMVDYFLNRGTDYWSYYVNYIAIYRHEEQEQDYQCERFMSYVDDLVGVRPVITVQLNN